MRSSRHCDYCENQYSRYCKLFAGICRAKRDYSTVISRTNRVLGDCNFRNFIGPSVAKGLCTIPTYPDKPNIQQVIIISLCQTMKLLLVILCTLFTLGIAQKTFYASRVTISNVPNMIVSFTPPCY